MERRWVATRWGAPDQWRFETYEPPAPGEGEVTIRVHAAGVNPADAKHVAAERPGVTLPVAIGYEVSGEIIAVGDAAEGQAPFRVGDEVIAFRIRGGYATAVTVPAAAVLAKPATLTHPEAANLLLAGTTAAEMLSVVGAKAGETVLLHGASGAVGVSVLQQAAVQGIRVIGTAHPDRFDEVRRFGGVPVAYGPGLLDRVRAVLDETGSRHVDAALDAVGTDEAVDVSLALVDDPRRIVTIAAPARAKADGILAIAGSHPDSARFRDAARQTLVDLADSGLLTVPLARTYPLEEAVAAHTLLSSGHPGGKIALIP